MNRRSIRDPRLTAEIVDRVALPGVRAASALAVRGDEHWVVQDDVLAVAVVSGRPRVVELPTGADGRRVFGEADGTKHLKADLESALALPDGRWVLLGSGSLAARERAFVFDGDTVSERPLPSLYATLRDALRAREPSVELNLEGAVVTGGSLRLLQRGNGRGQFDAELRLPLAAFVAHLDGGPPPAPPRVVGWSLGAIDGARLTFTDGLGLGPARFLYLAAAEDSPNAVDDGPVVGSALGVVGPRGARWAPLTEGGRVVPIKAEGLARDARGWWVSTDADDPEAASELLRVELRGPWGTA